MTPNGLDPTKWGFIGYVTPDDLWNWFLDPNQNLPGEDRQPKNPSPGKRRYETQFGIKNRQTGRRKTLRWDLIIKNERNARRRRRRRSLIRRHLAA